MTDQVKDAGTIKNRSEILFLYDVTDANPNGDPVDENKPRIDEETGINIVTDVRLKRTIRDYLHDYLNQTIYILGKRKEEDWTLETKEERFKEDNNDPKQVIKNRIDIRLFGGTFALKKGDGKKKDKKKDAEEEDTEREEKDGTKAWALTGPVQFKFGRSLHKVDVTYVKGTTVMPSKGGAAQGTLTECYILPYSLIAFYGVVNENAAKHQNIPLTDNDVSLMLNAVWNGAKNLISRSKFGQMPRLLVQVVYKENANYHVGELDKLVRIAYEKRDEELRNISDVKIDISELCKTLAAKKDKIQTIRLKADDRAVFIKDGSDITLTGELNALKGAFDGLKVETFNF
ncbi:Csh2 family CRISPR-associated protein [Candidatus Magnetoovum chiemensis]|nr:Csh2 family CRISPR-associated protein [Candidatus Magnetoovum chiemensis]